MLRIYILAAVVLLFAGCRSGPDMQFYMLDAERGMPVFELPAQGNSEVAIGLGPIRLPGYLDRPQMVTAVGENRYRLDDKHRWAERLDDNIGRTLLQSLSRRFGTVRWVRHPWPQRQVVTYQIAIDILELHQYADDHSRLLAQWQLKKQDEVVTIRNFDCSQPADSADTDAVVAAQSECLTRFAAEISVALQQLLSP